MSLSEIERFFQSANHFSWIDLTGGEALLRPDIIPLVEIVLRHSPRLYHLHLPTNAVSATLTIQRIQEILALGPPKLTITLSLDGPPALHDKIRGVEGNWQSVMAVYRYFMHQSDPRLQLFFGFTLSDYNLGGFSATVRAVQELFPDVDVRQWHMNLAHHSEHYYGNGATLLQTMANRDAWIAEITAFRERKQGFFDPVAFLEGRYLTHAVHYIRTGQTPMPCKALLASLFMEADGNCFPCSIWNRPLGNIRDFDYNLHRLLAAESVSMARQEIKAKQCAHCWTPCDAYPTILGQLFSPFLWSRV